MYEIACEAFYQLYFNYTNDYYERNLGVYLTAKKTKHQKLYRHMRERLARMNAVKEGKNIIEYLRSLKKLINEIIYHIGFLIKGFISGIILLFKVLIYLIKKPFTTR